MTRDTVARGPENFHHHVTPPYLPLRSTMVCRVSSLFFLFFSSTFLQRTFIYPSLLDIRKRFIFETIELSLAAKFKGVESHFCFPPCLTPFSTTPAVPLSHSSNLSPSSPFLSSRLEGDADHWKKALPVRGERRGTHIHASGKRKHYIYIYIYASNYALSRRRKNPRKQQFRTMSGTDNRAIITKRGEPRNNKHESFSYHTTNDSYRNDKKAST